MKKHGFTLIELMIVVAIIAIIAAIAIPNLMRSKMQSNESAAISNLKAICSAQVTYHAANGVYTTSFGDLTGGTPPFLDGNWDGATKQGYKYTLGGDADDFTCTADPATMNKTGSKGFFVDSTAQVRWAAGGVADSTSTPLGEVAGS